MNGLPMTMLDRGYYNSTKKLIETADQANPGLIGVQLGLLCVNNNIPVNVVAEALKVSRQTVYSWFIDKHRPGRSKEDAVKQLIAEYKAQYAV